MDGLGAEVTQKIRSAIEAKLMELGAFVDELPEYVMVMVGNKRSQAQMENDLQLFLGNNTVPFTTWLYQVLQKLQEVTISQNKNEAKGKKRERTPSAEDQDCLNIRAEADGDILEDEIPVKKAKSADKEKPVILPSASSKPADKSLEQSTQTISKIRKLDRDDNNKQAKEIVAERRRPREEISAPKNPEEASHRRTPVEVAKTSIKDDTKRKKIAISPPPKETPREKVPVKETNREKEKIVYDARELLNRRKAEKLAGKDDVSKRRRDKSPDDRKLKKTSHIDSDSVSRRRRSTSRDSDRERNSKDSAVKSSVHRTSLKRKTGFSDDRRSEERERGNRKEDEKKTDSYSRSKVIRISETVKAEQEILKPRLVKPNVPERSRNVRSQLTVVATDFDRDKEREQRDSGVSSIVRVTPRPVRPASQQPSSSLILKAMAEANKSLATAPSKIIPTSWKTERGLRGPLSPEKITVTLPNHRIQPITKEDKENEMYLPVVKEDDGEMRAISRRAGSKRWVSQEVEEDGDGDMEQNEEIEEEIAKEEDKSDLDDILDVGGENSINFSTNPSCSSQSQLSTVGKEKGVTEAINQWLKGVENAEPALDKYSCQETDLDSEPVLEICQNISELEPEEPEFVVTLNGLDPDLYSCESDEHDEDQHEEIYHEEIVNEEEEEEEEEVPVAPAAKKEATGAADSLPKNKRTNSPIVIVKPQNTNTAAPTENVESKSAPVAKSLERCKYWPNCLLGENCSFIHPTTLCKMFPSCKYGDHCLYIHPACKFGISCTRRDCQYRHNSSATVAAKAKANMISGVVVQNCKFYPNCSNLNCPFYHPKPCRFGVYCTKKSCIFDHSQGIGSKDKLKWTRLQQ